MITERVMDFLYASKIARKGDVKEEGMKENDRPEGAVD